MINRLSLRIKVNLILAIIFVGGTGLSWFGITYIMARQAEAQIGTASEMLRKSMNAVRDYTGSNVSPRLKPAQATSPTFLRETVPGFAAREVFESLRLTEGFDEFRYKEASPNPTNPRDRADDFEESLVAWFVSHPDLKTKTGFREVEGKKLFYSASPLTVTKPSCLECHSNPEAAPPSMITEYGRDNGFGWHLHQIIAAQVVYLPAARVLDQGQQDARRVVLLFAEIFGVVILLINMLLRRNVIRPLNHLAAATAAVGRGAEHSERFEETEAGRSLRESGHRGDELGRLAGTFGLMAEKVRERERGLRRPGASGSTRGALPRADRERVRRDRDPRQAGPRSLRQPRGRNSPVHPARRAARRAADRTG